MPGTAPAFTTKEDGGHTLLTKAGTQGTNSHLAKYSVIPTPFILGLILEAVIVKGFPG